MKYLCVLPVKIQYIFQILWGLRLNEKKWNGNQKSG